MQRMIKEGGGRKKTSYEIQFIIRLAV